MKSSPRRLLIMLLFVLAAAQAHACTVPVFRYALEQWQAEPYQVYVFHRGALSGADQAAIDMLRNAGDAEGFTNLQVDSIDLDGTLAEEPLAVWNIHKSPTLPWTVVLFPESSDSLAAVWAGKLDPAAASQLIDSPARQEIGRRLLSGDSVVWILLESGRKEADASAAVLLQKEIPALEKRFEQPDPDEADPSSELRSRLPLQTAFSTLRVKRDDPRENIFVKMLVQSQPAMKEAVPMVFPVFGRGRALVGLGGEELNAKSFKNAAEFLLGDCSCQVKELNPGIDLLMTVDWEKIFDETHAADVRARIVESNSPRIAIPEAAPAILKTEKTEKNTPKSAPAISGATQQKAAIPASADSEGQPFWLWFATAAAGLLVLVTGRAVLKTKPPRG